MPRLLGFVLFTTLLIPLVAVGQPYERVVRDTVDLAPGAVSLENEDGRVAVSTWGRDSVAYEARIVSEAARKPVEQTEITVSSFAQTLSLEANYEEVEGRWSFGPKIYGYGTTHPAVEYTLVVPETADLSIENRDSAVEIRGLQAPSQVESHDGPVRVVDHEGPLQVEMHEGTVDVQRLRGGLALDLHEGDASVQFGTFEETTVDTHGGTVTLTLPSDAGFDLATDLDEAASLSSSVDLSSVREEEGAYAGAVRGGGPLLRIASDEGAVEIDAP